MLAFHYDTVGSTNTEAARLSALNPGRPLLVSARRQTAGRGRSGRAWRSPAGGAWFSVAFPGRVSPHRMEAAPLVAGLAVMDAVEAVLGDAARRLQIKWPNDLLLDGRKLAGILCERTLPMHAEVGAVAHTLVVGVGVNVDVDPAALGDDLRHPATSLAAVGRHVFVPRLVQAAAGEILAGLQRLADHGFTPELRDRVDERLAWVGQRVSLAQRGNVVEGVLRGVDKRGLLVLEVNGTPTPFHAGDVGQLRTLPHEPLAA